MKKFVFITLVFALAAGAAFAQDGEWSVQGLGEIGTVLNFVPRQEKDKVELARADGNLLTDNDIPLTLIGANGYNYIDYYGYVGGSLGIKYSRGDLSTGLDIGSFLDDVFFRANITYNDQTRAFQIEANVDDVLRTATFAPGKLWGWYKFLDGAITLETAVVSTDSNYWFSNGVIGDLFGSAKINSNNIGWGFTDTDGHNFLLADIAPGAISGLSFGFMVPRVFVFKSGDADKWQNGASNGGFNWAAMAPNVPGYADFQPDKYHVKWVDQSLLFTRLGAKFATGPIEVAMQFALQGKQIKKEVWKEDGDDELWKLRNVVYGKDDDFLPDGLEKEIILTSLYLGGKFNINDNLNAGLAFEGVFHSKEPELGFGANVGFSTGPFSAGLLLGLHTKIIPGDRWYPVLKTESVENAPGVPYDEKFGRREFDGVLTWDIDTDKGLKEENPSSYLRAGGWNRKNAVNDTTIGVKPSFAFNVVENYLAVSLDTFLFWKVQEEGWDIDGDGVVDGYVNQRAYQHNVFGYEVIPQIFFNVAGTGAGADYWWPNTTAIIVRYRIGGWFAGKELRSIYKSYNLYDDSNYGNPRFNQLDITFKWAF